jgi:hypothetical protein
MKDLLVYTADADAEAVIRSVLKRHKALDIRKIESDIERHPLRDAGMFQSGAELARMKKRQYGKALLIWDYHGSGRDKRQTAEDSQQEIQAKLNEFTWKDNSATVVLVPELEEWLWHNLSSIAVHLGWTVEILENTIDIYANARNCGRNEVYQKYPKELFEFVMRKAKRTISPRDFEQIAQKASMKDWQNSPSFYRILQTLRSWFPQV